MHREPPPRPGWSWPRRSPSTWPRSAAPSFGNPEEYPISISSQRWIMANVYDNHVMVQETLRWWHLWKLWRRWWWWWRRWWWWWWWRWWWWRRWWWWWWWRWWWQWPFQFQWLPGRVDRASASTPHLPLHPGKLYHCHWNGTWMFQIAPWTNHIYVIGKELEW